MDSFAEQLDSLIHECALWGGVSAEKIAAPARACTREDVPALVAVLGSQTEEDFVDDPGDDIDDWYKLRAVVVEMLRQVGTPAVDCLLAALDSPNSFVRVDAARALGQIGDRRAVSNLLAMLPTPTAMLETVFTALGDLGDLRASATIRSYLDGFEGQNRSGVIAVAAYSLAQIEGPMATERLAQVLATDPDWYARLGAARGLALIHDATALEELCKALRDPSRNVADFAFETLQEEIRQERYRAYREEDSQHERY